MGEGLRPCVCLSPGKRIGGFEEGGEESAARSGQRRIIERAVRAEVAQIELRRDPGHRRATEHECAICEGKRIVNIVRHEDDRAGPLALHTL